MAALWEAAAPRLVDLRQVRPDLMEPMLMEETRQWRRTLQWDFTASADLVRRFVQMHALNGYALTVDGHPVGYSYYVCEDRKGLVGDLFVMEEFRSVENENVLLAAVLNNLMNNAYTCRIECQLLMLQMAKPEMMSGRAHLQTYWRNFMTADLEDISTLPHMAQSDRFTFETFSEFRQEEAARVIASAYEGHVDARINDQYQSVNGARHFLLNIVQYPGCGTFFQPASWLAYHNRLQRACGVCLCSTVAPDIGHITQICVLPELQGQQVGYELLRRALTSLADRGCRAATLTVTASNTGAVQLYERMGFRILRTFPACVWEGF
jgi:ribosomal protein S18 acetylase RimI-like enzyme